MYAQIKYDMAHAMTILAQLFTKWIVQKLAIGAGVVIGLNVLRDFIPIEAPLLVGVLVFLVIDWVTGVLAARKRGDQLSSKVGFRTAWKALIYLLILVLAFIMQSIFLGKPGTGTVTEAFVNWLSFFILFNEFVSVLENLVVIAGQHTAVGRIITLAAEKALRVPVGRQRHNVSDDLNG